MKSPTQTAMATPDRSQAGSGAVAAQQAEAHAAIPDDDQPEEAVDHRHDRCLDLQQVAEQQLLGELVDDQRRRDQDHGLAIDASHARLSTAPSQRWQISGCLADLPTSSSTCQQRAHLSPVGQRRHDGDAGDVGQA